LPPKKGSHSEIFKNIELSTELSLFNKIFLVYLKIFLVFSASAALGTKGLQRLKVRGFAVIIVLKVRGFAVIIVLKVRGFAALPTTIPQLFSENFNFNLTYDKSEAKKRSLTIE
jgi:hypothetical protein